MPLRQQHAAALAALALAACERQGSRSPWLTMPSQAEHAERYFRIGPGTSHPAASCDDCHGGTESFVRYDCVGCHAGDAERRAALLAAATHATHPDFPDVAAADTAPERIAASEACVRCHPDGRAEVIDPAVHTLAYFPIDVGSAHASPAAVACAACHVDPADRHVLGCAGCHGHDAEPMAAAHAGGVQDYAFASPVCVRCHAEAQVDPVSAHAPFLLGVDGHSGPEEGECLLCHGSTRTDRPWAADFTTQDCLGCHEQADTAEDHLLVPTYTWSTPSCLASACHPAGREPGD